MSRYTIVFDSQYAHGTDTDRERAARWWRDLPEAVRLTIFEMEKSYTEMIGVAGQDPYDQSKIAMDYFEDNGGMRQWWYCVQSIRV